MSKFLKNASFKLPKLENIGMYAKKLASTIDEQAKNFVNEISKENETKKRTIEEYPYPWSDEIDEENIKDTIVALSMDDRNFLISPTNEDNFEFELKDDNLKYAINLLKVDKRLEKLRYNIVPKQINEESFWKNYFFRIHMIKSGKDIKNLPNIFLPEIIPKAEDATEKKKANNQKSEELFATDAFDKENTSGEEEEEELLKDFEKEIDDAILMNDLNKNTTNEPTNSDMINDTSSLDETMQELEKTLKETI